LTPRVIAWYVRLVPSHALPPGSPEARARQRAKRRGGVVQVLAILTGPLVGWAFIQNGQQEHASVLYYFASVIVGAVTLIATVGAMYLSARASAKLVRPRPRWLYGLLGIAYFGPVAVFVRVAVAHVRAHTQNQTSWAAVAGGLLALYCGAAGLLMLGRALCWGRPRRTFWLFPPQWVDQLYPPPGAASGDGALGSERGGTSAS
jgi:hypothetical protein